MTTASDFGSLKAWAPGADAAMVDLGGSFWVAGPSFTERATQWPLDDEDALADKR